MDRGHRRQSADGGGASMGGQHGARAAAAAIAMAVVASLADASAALAATPVATDAGIGDPRGGGPTPGFAGDPGLAIVIVLLIGLVSLLATLAWVRATGSRRDAGPDC